MVNQGPIKRHKLDIFDRAYAKQQAVKRITMLQFGSNFGKDMVFINLQKLEPMGTDKTRQQLKLHLQAQFV